MKALALLITAAAIVGMLALSLGAARLSPALTWAGVGLLGAGFAGYYFTP